MARIRSIKPEFWIDEKIVDLSPWARLLFIGIWNFADDQGYIEHKSRRIKMQVFPGDEVDVDQLIKELIAADLLAPYESPIGAVLHVRNWERHQRVDKAAQPRFDPSQLKSSRGLARAREGSREVVELTGESDQGPDQEFAESSRGLASLPLALAPDLEGKGSGRDLEGIASPSPDGDGTRLARQPPLPKRGSRIAADFKIDQRMSAWAADKVPNLDINFHTEKFINYWTAKSGSNAMKLDWFATWKNWMLDENARLPTRNGTVATKGELRDWGATA